MSINTEHDAQMRAIDEAIARERGMKPEQQRIAIAEACGWLHYGCEGCAMSPCVCDGWIHHTIDGPQELPDYLNDLDAMHEAEQLMLSDSGRKGWRAAYGNNLAKVVGANGSGTWHDEFLLIRSTAAQRAEAFLRTLNLWTP